MSEQMIYDRMSQLIRVGFVTARQPEKHRVQVELRDTVTSPLVTDWLPVLVPRASADLHYDLPDIGDQVLCLFLAHGLEQGFVIGSMYGKQTPPVSSAEKFHRTFKDGTIVEYDREEHKLTATVKGEVEIVADGQARVESKEKLTLAAPAIHLEGVISMQNYGGGGATTADLRGTMNVRDGSVNAVTHDVTAQGVSLYSHQHKDVEPGSGTTGIPVGGDAAAAVGAAAGAAGGSGTSSGGGESGGSGEGQNDGDATSAGETTDQESTDGDSSDSEGGTGSSGTGGTSGGAAAGVALDAAALAAEIATNLATLEEDVAERGSDIDRLIMCLPRIAQEEAERQSNGNDRKGWLYLRDMVELWLGRPENADELKNPNVFWVDWKWVFAYQRATTTLGYLMGMGKLINEAACAELTAILKRDDMFSSEKVYFDYTTDDSDYFRWKKDYFQQETVPGFISNNADGLMAAMGDFQLRALARGYTEPLKIKHGHKVVIQGISVFVWDSFNFDGEYDLKYWNCKKLAFSRFSSNGYTNLHNSDFNKFRTDHHVGNDFLVLTHPHPVDIEAEFSYETDL